MNPYFEQTILYADPIDLIRMLYQRPIFCVRGGVEHLRNKRIAQRSAAILRAYSVIAELNAALRPEAAPELSARLRDLYFYIQQRLLCANAQQADQPLAEVLGLLTTMEEGWSGAAAKLAPQKEMTDTMEQVTARRGGHHAWQQSGPGNDELARLAVRA